MYDSIPRHIQQLIDPNTIQPWYETFKFGTLAAPIAEGGSATIERTNDSRFYFIVYDLLGAARIPVAIANGIEEYADYPRSISGASNAVANLNFVEIQLRIGQWVTSNEPVPIGQITGTGERPYRLPVPWVIDPQYAMRLDVFNRANETDHDIFGEVILAGIRAGRRAAAR